MSLSINTNSKLALENLDLKHLIYYSNNYIGIRTDIALAEIISDLSRSKLTNWLKEGHILINQNQRNLKTK